MLGPVVLPADIQFVPLSNLPAQLRTQIQGDDSDFAVTRPRSRTPSKVVDSGGKELLEQFREPSTIVDAIVRHSKTLHVAPSQLLEDAYPLIQSLLASKLLVEPGVEAETITPHFKVGDRHTGWDVIQSVQVLVDSELHRVKNAEGQEAALKFLRPGAPKHVRRAFAHEAAILRILPVGVAPKLLLAAEDHLLTEWCEGADAGQAAQGKPELCAAIVEAYAQLHSAGVLHGDVHPRNVMIMHVDQAVRLIDFGLARRLDGHGHRPGRGGIAFFTDPEMAAANRRGAPPPPVTPPSEQYAVAAMLYLLLTGKHYLDFSLERQEMLRQITDDAPLPLVGSPALEPVLFRALSKQPAARFASMSEFAASFRQALRQPQAPEPDTSQQQLDTFVETFLAQFADPQNPPAYVGPEAPTASLTYGAAGVAYSYLRIAQARGDARLLALADRWADRATQLSSGPMAFYHEAIEIKPEVVGVISPYHTGPGVAAVAALTAHAFGDLNNFQRAVNQFLESSAQPCENLDITLGRSGSVLAASLLLDAWQAVSSEPAPGLIEFGNRTLAGIWQELALLPPIEEEKNIRYLGIAHGWAGFAYAALRWRKSTGGQLPPGLETRLEELARCAQPTCHGVQWPFRLHTRDAFAMKGWCNGGAGQVFLWSLAHELLGHAQYAALAEATALDVFHAPNMQIETLCCGLAGAAYAQLTLYKRTRDPAWLQRARQLAVKALAVNSPAEALPNSLYKGRVGAAVLAAELAQPEFAAMPMFEERRWPAR